MQDQYGEAAETAILSPERSFRARVRVDWDKDGRFSHPMSDMSPYVQSASTERELSGSAPNEVLLIEGAASAQLKVLMAGEFAGLTLASVFSPYNTLSPLYGNPVMGADIEYSLGVETMFGTFWYSQFVGSIRKVTPRRSDAGVDFECLDRAEDLRRPISFPTWAVSESHRNCEDNELSQLCDSSWVIDHCLRHNDTSPSPYRPTFREDLNDLDFSQDGTQLWITGTGSFLPTVGWVEQPTYVEYPRLEGGSLKMFERKGLAHPDSPEFENLPFNMASLGTTDGTFGYWVRDRDEMPEAGIHLLSFTMINRGQNATSWQTLTDETPIGVFIGGTAVIAVHVGGGKVWSEQARCNADGSIISTGKLTTSKITIPTDRETVRVNVLWDNRNSPGGINALVSVDELTTGLVQLKTGNWWGAGSIPNHVLKGNVWVETKFGFADMCYAVRAPGTTPAVGYNAGRPAKYAASLDEGLQKLTYLPVKKGDDAWTVITNVAAAEYGSVFWDESGRFRFWNYQRMLDLQDTVVRRYSLDDLSELKITNTLDSVRNIWSIETKSRIAAEKAVYESKSYNEFYMPASGLLDNTKKFRVIDDEVITVEPGQLKKCTADENIHNASGLRLWDENILHGYVAQFEYGEDDWRESASLIMSTDVRCFIDASGQIVLQVYNASGKAMRFASINVKADNPDVEVPDDPDGAEVDSDPTPMLRIRGDKVIDYGTDLRELNNRGSIKLYGGRNLKFSGDWYQDGIDLEAMAEVLMPRMLKPAPTTDSITVAGDPRTQLGDCIEINDRSGFGEGIRLQIYGIRREFSLDGGLTDELTIEMIQPVTLGVDPTVPPTVLRRNLCPVPAVDSLTGWVSDGDIDRVPVTNLPRPWGVEVQDYYVTTEAPKGSVTAGNTYRFSAWVKASATRSLTAKAHIIWYTAGNVFISETPAVNVSASRGQIVRVDSLARIAPSGAAKATLEIYDNSRDYVITAVLYEENDQLLDYFDGYSSFGSWEGTPGSSTSVITEVIIPDVPDEPDVDLVPYDGSLEPPA